MSTKEDLLKEIATAKAEIVELESKIMRSQTSIIESLIDKEEPKDNEKNYFKTLLSLINLNRQKLQMLSDELEFMKKKK